MVLGKLIRELVSQGRHCEALCEAFRRGMSKEAEEILGNGCDINCKTEHGATPLMYAASGQSLGMIEFGAKHGADGDARSHDGATALHWLFRGMVRDDVAYPLVLQLLEMNVDPNAEDSNGKQAIDVAKEKGCERCVRELHTK